MEQTFPRIEKLKSKQLIGQVFSKGKSVKKFPVLLLYYPLPTHYTTHKVAVSVPKRNFKKAVDRNRIKRLIREAYRTQKQIIYTPNHKKFAILFLYLGKEHKPYSKIQQAVNTLLHEIN
ncbi:ribonuclease P protein component [Mesonia hippocampi]|uniref:Ribonuclease P protein component n=1 Tax=Mesonia hippocampi TaxID=1628250 RepID=A0A840EST1_9FLAO|nr:ribonuclease P protein component [Mesonia hippocampi]MBB4118456.1 ribonuclease P protein component [Mesonia hippocampi]